ncbi:MAG: GNAT family N-acetyltransferase [Bacteroidetes bacterium]|nr:GNAT family N-acetyltransferase [Bacteroidota bacterium]
MEQFLLPHTTRCKFKLIKSNDFESFSLFRKNEALMNCLDQEPESEAKIRVLLSKMPPQNNTPESIWWFILDKESRAIIGYFGFNADNKNKRAEIGYVLFEEYRRMGFLSEALPVLLNSCFNTFSFHSLEAKINPLNKASIALIEKFNFVKEAHFKQNYLYKNLFTDTAVYSLLKSNYVPRGTK